MFEGLGPSPEGSGASPKKNEYADELELDQAANQAEANFEADAAANAALPEQESKEPKR